MRSAIAFLIFFFALPGHAQHVYKCAKDGDVSYQSAPCERGQHLVKQWEATPTPEPPAAGSGRRQAKQKQDLVVDSRRTRSARHARTTSSISAADNRCRTAKARREAKLASVGLKRTFDLLRKLDDAVYEACK